MNEEQIHARRWWTLVVLCVSLLVIVMDNTILNVALPTLQKDLSARQSQLQWIVDSYTLIFAGLLLTMGALSDKLGRKTLLFFGFVVFGIGSLASAFAKTPTQLTLTRAFMGIGGAAIMPSTLSIITNVFRDSRERARAIGAWAGVAGLGVALGPVIGGWLIEHFYWGSVFLINLPILAFGLIAGYFLIPQSYDPSHPRMDFGGALLSIAGLISLVWAIIEAPDKGWTSAPVIVAGSLGLILLATFAYWEYRSDHPMLDVHFFENPRFSAASAAITINFFVLFGSLFGITIYLQQVLGYSALQAGIRYVPFAITMMFFAPMSARVVERVGTKITVATGLTLIALALLTFSTITVDSGYARIFWAFELMAVGMGNVMAPATESIMGSLPRAKAGVGSAVNDTTRQVGGALGVAILGSLLNSSYIHNLTSNLEGSSVPANAIETSKEALGAALSVSAKLPAAAATELTNAARSAYTDGLQLPFYLGAGLLFAGALIVLKFLPARAVDAPHLDPHAVAVEDEKQAELEAAFPPA
jgi:EmrB/QacA subfamily drug resistance transporter